MHRDSAGIGPSASRSPKTASVLTFAEDLFGLGRLAADARANSPAGDCFNFNQKPRAFVPIDAPKDRNFFLYQKPDLRPRRSERFALA